MSTIMRLLRFWYTIWMWLPFVISETTAFQASKPLQQSSSSQIISFHVSYGQPNQRNTNDDKWTELEGPVYLRFSNNFQRHVIYGDAGVVESFEFLDDAIEAYPSAQLSPFGVQTFVKDLPHFGIVAGGGKEEQTAYRRAISGDELEQRTQSGYEALLTLSNLVTGSTSVSIVGYLADRVGKFRFLTHTNTTISSNFINVLHLMNQIGFSPLVAKQSLFANFPQVCLYEPKEVAERLRFLLSSTPPKNYTTSNSIDWPLLASQGFGAGFTRNQVGQMLKGLPHILAMTYEDAAQKPNFFYFHQALRVPKELCDEAKEKLYDYLDGATPSDVSMMAYLRSLGASWDQLSIVLQAFPALVTCDTDPSWIIYHKSPTRFVFKEHSLHYLRARLQVSPGQVQSMIKTHVQLSSYSITGNILPTLNALQERLGLSSRDMRRILLRMPSLIGMSIENGLKPRMSFFIDEIGFTRNEFSKIILKQPSLLQSSLNKALRPKVAFFVEETKIPLTTLRKVILTSPTLLGLSLNENIRPTSEDFMDHCKLSWEQMGELIIKNPDLLTLSWKRNLLPTLQFLQQRLDLTTLQLRDLVSAAPRMMQYGINTSLGPKIDTIQHVLGLNGDIRQVLLANPALLVMTWGALERRLSLSIASSTPLADALLRRHKQSNNKLLRGVIGTCLETNTVTTYPNAKIAATELDISLQKVYGLCRSGKVFGGKTYFYDDKTVSNASIPFITKTSTKKVQMRRPMRVRNANVLSPSLADNLRQSDYSLERDYPNSVAPIVVYVAGRTYPTDDFEQVRGARRAGGMSLLFPQVACGDILLTERLREATEQSFAQIMAEDEGGTSYNNGTILNGYPYFRPSRNRCELYACHDALKVILQLLKQEAAANGNAAANNFQVDIYTDSDYAWKLLRNQSQILEWGSFSSEDAVEYTGPGHRSSANLDLLFPLCRTYTRLVLRKGVDFSAGVSSPELCNEISILFRHATSDGVTEYSRQMAESAKIAAAWHFERATVAKGANKIIM